MLNIPGRKTYGIATAIADPTLNALAEQLECYKKLARLAEVQHEHIQQNQVEELLVVLEQRQVVLNQLANLEAVIAPAKAKWPEYLSKLDSVSKTKAESMLAQSRALLEQITTSDRNDSLVLQQRKLNIGRQIDQASSARQVNKNYAAAAYGQKPTSMDLKQ